MNWFKSCEHQWKIINRSYVQPLPNIEVKGKGASELLKLTEFLKLTGGYTVILLQCTKCGDVKSQEILGKHDEYMQNL